MTFSVEQVAFVVEPAFWNGFVFGVGATGLVWLVTRLWRRER